MLKMPFLFFTLAGVTSLCNNAQGATDTTETGVSTTHSVHERLLAEVDFGEEGDIILQVYLRDILLSDAMFAIVKNNRVYLPFGELVALVDFPILVDAVAGKAAGWYLRPENTFILDREKGILVLSDNEISITNDELISDEVEIYVDMISLQKWLPLVFDISLSSQRLTLRSPFALPKELERERAARSIKEAVTFEATRDYQIPDYRIIDWPEISANLGGYYAPDSQVSRFDYRLNAFGDIAFMNGKVSANGTQDQLDSVTIKLGRKNPGGMMGPLRIADFELGDTLQFLPGLIGPSLSGRGFRFGNTRLSNHRDLDTVDVQGEQQTGYEIELYVNDRLLGVDRDSDDTRYAFEDVPLRIGQNEIRLEFYGPQGQRFTETKRTFVGSGQNGKGKFKYEFAMLEPGQRTIDVIDDVQMARDNGQLPDLQLSSALNMNYGISRKTNLGLTIASVATNDTDENSTDNSQTYFNARTTTDLSGNLLSFDLTTDSNANIASSIGMRTRRGDYELGATHRYYQKDFRSSNDINNTTPQDLPHNSTTINLSRSYFGLPLGRLSYGFDLGYNIDQSGSATGSSGSRIDYHAGIFSGSWSHNYSRDFENDKRSTDGQVAFTLKPVDHWLWSFSTDFAYNDSQDKFISAGSLRAARPLGAGSSFSVSASRDLQEETTFYSAAWNKQLPKFRFTSSASGSTWDDIAIRLGLDFYARRHPGRWLPSFARSGGSASVAALVFADDNKNGKHDESEDVIEGVRLTRNGLMTDAVTDENGVALMTGLSSNTSIDINIIASDINDPTLKPQQISDGILPRPGRIPVIQVPLLRATDLEGTVTVAGSTPAPNVRMLLTPVGDGEPMVVMTEFDGFYSLSGIPLGEYEFGPDIAQLESVGLTARPATRTLNLSAYNDLPEPEDFDLIRLNDESSSTARQLQSAVLNTISTLKKSELSDENSQPVPTVSDPQSVSLLTMEDHEADKQGKNTLSTTVVTTESSKRAPNKTEVYYSEEPILAAAYQDSQVEESVIDLPKNADSKNSQHGSCTSIIQGADTRRNDCTSRSAVIRDIKFTIGSSSINTESAFALDALARVINANPNLEFTIRTHTDNRGSPESNLTLTIDRTSNILRYLLNKGTVSRSQLAGFAYGDRKPIASNETAVGRATNRRVEVTARKQISH